MAEIEVLKLKINELFQKSKESEIYDEIINLKADQQSRLLKELDHFKQERILLILENKKCIFKETDRIRRKESTGGLQEGSHNL